MTPYRKPTKVRVTGRFGALLFVGVALIYASLLALASFLIVVVIVVVMQFIFPGLLSDC